MITLKEIGFDQYFQDQIREEERSIHLVPARISEVHKESYKIISEHGEKGAKLKSSIFYQESDTVVYPCVGDFVLVKENEMGEDIIHRVLDRKSFFARVDPHMGTKTHLVARQSIIANYNYVFLMESLNYDYNLRKLERYLSIAWSSGGIPVVLLTKSDLCDDIEEKVKMVELIAPGVQVIAISVVTGDGLEKLEPYLQPGNTIALLGSSGIGKSSLVNAMVGAEVMKVSDIREEDSRGRHTTTHRELIFLRNGAMFIDTPGMRELGMWDNESGVSETFADIEELLGLCKYSDCSHNKEQGCAIREGLDQGSIDQKRWASYQKLIKEAEHTAKKAQMIRIKEKHAQKKSNSTRRVREWSVEQDSQ